MTSIRSWLRWTILAAGLAFTATACASAPPEAAQGDGGRYAQSVVVAPSVNRVSIAGVEGLLPNEVTELGEVQLTVSDAVLLADIARVEAGAAYRVPEDPGATSGVSVDPDGPDADWRSILITLEPVEVLGVARIEVGERPQVTMTLRGDVDIDRALRSIRSIGRGVFFLHDAPHAIDGDTTVDRLALAGASTMAVEDDGGLTFPFASAEIAEIVGTTLAPGGGAVPAGLSLSELRHLAAEPVEIHRPRP